LTGRRLYQTISEKIRFFDFGKARREKSGQLKNGKLREYQDLLNRIKDIHIRVEDADIQQEAHLVGHYRDDKRDFFEKCAACFGYKKSHSMIIKYFSWKNGADGQQHV